MDDTQCALMAAMEFGYKAHEKGMNIQEARQQVMEVLLGVKPENKSEEKKCQS